ncbi:MAG: hypothetical protein ISF22_10695 [Methanomassiliicoccus sp.]|nr:hypothetical protein [Methanomassiliicoccus sp.]
MKGWDRRALEGLPLRLLIMALLVSLTLPVVLGSMESYERTTARTRLAAEAERVGGVIEEVMSAGEGNRRIVTVELPESLAKFSMRLEVGGAIGSAESLTVRCLEGGAVFRNIVLEDPPARTTTADGRGMVLEAGMYRLAVECVRADDRAFVLVSVSL